MKRDKNIITMIMLLLTNCCLGDIRKVPVDYLTIQAAIDDANNGDIVLVTPGIYSGDGNRDIDFKGKAITVKSEDGPQTCIIDCQGSEEDPHRGFRVYSQSDSNAILDGFSVTNGYADESGGGIFCGESGIVKNSIVTKNRAVSGGGIFITGNGILMNCIIANNMTIFGSTDRYHGGGVDATRGYPVIVNCTISGNRASSIGGGLACGYRGTATLENCIIVGNKAISGDQISTTISTINVAMGLDVRNCCIQSASCEDILQQSGPITMEDTIFLADPGFINPELVDFRLYPDSPCVDAGTITTSIELPATDIVDNPRISDGNRDGISLPDLGAYEIPAPEEPYILVSCNQLEYIVDAANPNSKTQVMTIQNLGLQTSNWTITQDCNWLQVSSEGGSLGSNPVDIVVTVDDSNLESAIYTCNLLISGENALNSPLIVPVTLYLPKTLNVPDGFETIQEAIDAANLYDTIVLSDSIYEGPGNYDISFHGKPITLRSENGPDNCTIGSQSDTGDFESVFIFNTQENSRSILEGVTLLSIDHKKAINCNQSSPTIRNCHFLGDGLRTSGMLLLWSFPVVENCIFKDCYRAIQCQTSNPKILSCGFQENETALYCTNSSRPYLYSCDVINNKGQAIHTEDGGGLHIFNSHIFGNGWGTKSPAVKCYRNTSIVKFVDCAISSNYKGIQLYGCTVEIQNSLISDNGGGSNQTGYGIHSEQSELLIDNSTLVGNGGDGLYFSYVSSILLRNAVFKNSIFWGNEPNQISGDKDLCIATYSNIQGGWEGEGNIDVDPLFTNPENGDYHLKSQTGRWDPNSKIWVIDDVTSPCIDAGDPNSSLGDEPEPNGSRINMGAYGGTMEASKSYSGELPSETIIAGDINGDFKVNFLDFALIASHWLENGY